MKLRIESDGTRKNTKLIADNGDEVENVSWMTWEFNEEEEFATATIYLREVGLDIKRDASAEIL